MISYCKNFILWTTDHPFRSDIVLAIIVAVLLLLIRALDLFNFSHAGYKEAVSNLMMETYSSSIAVAGFVFTALAFVLTSKGGALINNSQKTTDSNDQNIIFNSKDLYNKLSWVYFEAISMCLIAYISIFGCSMFFPNVPIFYRFLLLSVSSIVIWSSLMRCLVTTWQLLKPISNLTPPNGSTPGAFEGISKEPSAF